MSDALREVAGNARLFFMSNHDYEASRDCLREAGISVANREYEGPRWLAATRPVPGATGITERKATVTCFRN